MTEHSPEAVAAYPAVPGYGDYVGQQTLRDRTAFDLGMAAGRESKHLTDSETLAKLIGEHYQMGEFCACGERYASDHPFYARQHVADAILAAPSLSLVAVRDEMIRVMVVAEVDSYAEGVDALFASNTIKPSSEVEAASSAARVRSGKDEA